MDTVRILLAILLSSVVVAAQDLKIVPNAPSVAQKPAPAARCGPWKCWDNPSRPNGEVLRDRSYHFFVAADVLAASFDAEMSHHQGSCVEGGGLPPHPTRSELY